MNSTPFKVKLITYFFSLLLLTAGSLIYLQYYFSEKLAMQAGDQAFESILNNLHDFQKSQDRQSEAFLEIISTYPQLSQPVSLDEEYPLQTPFIKILSQNLNAYAIYWANLKGDFFEVINMHHSPLLYKQLKAPLNARWGIIKLSQDSDFKIKHYIFLDSNLNSIATRNEATDYKAYLRHWFVGAQNNRGVTRSAPYLFQHLQLYGITYSKFIRSQQVVVAVDYTNSEIENLLKQAKPSKDSYIFMFNENAELLMDSNGNRETAEKVNTSLQLYEQLKPLLNKSSGAKPQEITVNNRRYLARFVNTDAQQEHRLNLAMLIPMNDLTEPYRAQIQLSLLVALIILLILIPLIFLFARNLTRPIEALMNENYKIQHRQFDQVKLIETPIKELDRLSRSLVEMSNSIQQYQYSQTKLLDSIIKLVADAIDAKSPYTGGHCKRVPELAFMLLDAANTDSKTFKDFRFEDPDEIRSFHIGAWLHDCGKIVTPEHVVDKATKLETIYNRIHEIRTRFEVLWRDADIVYLQARLDGESTELAEQQRQATRDRLQEEFAFIASTNIGGEFLDEQDQERLKKIGKQTWQRHFNKNLGLSEEEQLRSSPDNHLPATESLLADKPEHFINRYHFDYEDYQAHGFKEPVPQYLYNLGELTNLGIARGTLNDEERFKIKEHVMMTIKMLEKLPFPQEYKNIIRYAGTHHETLDGKGYPRQLAAEDLSIPERIMSIADIFEALTAADRPYKPAKTLSQALQIMSFMRDDNHIDADLFALFIESGVYLEYAQAYLQPEQIDEINPADYIEK
ncbi:HD-GYP domain-containing protein [Thiomicrorhabdus sediminis]|uniref:HD domain-containing protein n=1 Tax=Thiomicrorhabdus sediminis TaxID=2580412 RepID=A0A4P9K7U6_9GAMM|nr:HD domain-containing phosphohydrolase [Thiomicrorhabdus sediminis]QCU91028.1 HD domain-containing protein [Thiomicrorhabdus sediminis]